MSTDDNLWHEVANFPDYQITKDGQIRSARKILKQSINPYGYKSVNLYRDKKPHCLRVHKLLLQTFKPTDDESLITRHLDGNKLNNSLDNLAWGTHKDNYNDAVRHGTYVHGETHGRSKLNPTKVKKIRELLKQGVSQRPLARMFGVSQPCINKVGKGMYWSHIND